MPFSDCYMKVKKPMNCEGHRFDSLDAAAKRREDVICVSRQTPAGVFPGHA